MIDGAPKRPPGARRETFTTRRSPLTREIHATSPVPSEASAKLGKNATSSIATVRAAPSDGPSLEPNATAIRARDVANPRVNRSAATDRRAYGRTRSVSRGSVRSRSNAAAPGASDAPRTPAVAPVPTPSWKPQSATAAPALVEPTSRPEMNVCGVEIVAGALHVAAAAGAAATSEAAAATAARAGKGRMPGQRA